MIRPGTTLALILVSTLLTTSALWPLGVFTLGALGGLSLSRINHALAHRCAGRSGAGRTPAPPTDHHRAP